MGDPNGEAGAPPGFVAPNGLLPALGSGGGAVVGLDGGATAAPKDGAAASLRVTLPVSEPDLAAEATSR